MSEFTQHTEQRIKRLTLFLEEIIKGSHTLEQAKANQEDIDNLLYSDVITIVDNIMRKDFLIDDIKNGVNRILNLFYKQINEQPTLRPKKDSFLDLFIQENTEYEIRLKRIKKLMREINQNFSEKAKAKLYKKLLDLREFEKHYSKKENILFPVLEKAWENYRCIPLMWSYHDNIRGNLKHAIKMLEADKLPLPNFNAVMGRIFFDSYAIMFRENKILFPYILQTIDNKEIEALLPQCPEIGFAYIKPDIKIEISTQSTDLKDGFVNLETGKLSVKQLILLFNTLPIDMTYVDENDEVKFFSTPKHRIFPRTVSIIGRKVHNCHPPESVHIVEQIVESFRKGSKDKADFWIQMMGKFILIQYYAIRNEKGEYKGVLEVSQDVTEIRQLQGEKRLLEWENN